MSRFHIFSADKQPLTRYFDPNMPRRGGHGVWVKTPPRKQYRCHECGNWRYAKNLTIQVYYDTVRIKCADACYGRAQL